jgi:hypothetical protein
MVGSVGRVMQAVLLGERTVNVAEVEGYRKYLVERNGEADLLNRRLANREVFFAAIEATPVRSRRTLDVDAFERGMAIRRPAQGLSPELAFVLATAKLNQAERFGVGLGETYGKNSTGDTLPERVHMELEEHYHTRLLAYVLDIFGLPFRVTPPAFVMRQFVKLAVFIPEDRSFAFVGASEMAGCAMFDLLGQAGSALFADEPEVADRIRLLYGEILTDEIGHVGYCAARCSDAGRGMMRLLYRPIARLFARQTPEILRVVGRESLNERLSHPFNFSDFEEHLSSAPFVAARP